MHGREELDDRLPKVNIGETRKGESMADWKSLLRKVLLADGALDAEEAALLREEIMDDGVVDQDEIRFLASLRDDAASTSPAFDAFFFEALKSNILSDGRIDEDEVTFLREVIFADGQVDENEKAFLTDLRQSAEGTADSFDALYDECIK